MKSTEVTLGGEKYLLPELPARKNAEWRKQLKERLGGVAEFVQTVQKLDITSLNDIAGMLRTAGDALIDSPATIQGLLFDYSPMLTDDRERIEAEAYDSETMAAFVEVLKLAFPFGALIQTALGVGSKLGVTGPSSPAPNGDAGTTN